MRKMEIEDIVENGEEIFTAFCSYFCLLAKKNIYLSIVR
jgi:hypothetical protein